MSEETTDKETFEQDGHGSEKATGLVKYTGFAAGLVILAIAASVIYEIVIRWIRGSGTTWVYEATGISLLWFTMLAGGYVLSQRKHIMIDVVVARLSARTRLLLTALGSALTLLYVSLLAYYSFELFWVALVSGQRTPTVAQVPLFVIFGVMTFGLAVFLLQATISLTRDVRAFWKRPGTVDAKVLMFFVAAVAAALLMWPIVPEIAILVLLFSLLAAGFPVFSVLGVVGMTGLYFVYGAESAFTTAADIAYSAVDSHTLLAIPLFIISGVVLQRSGLGADLYGVASTWLGGLRGGLGLATIVACAIFASISGSSVATAGAIGLIAIPEMLKRGYTPKNTYGMVAGGGTLGILIPPSTALIVYAGLTNESTGQLFMGGVIPAAILICLFAAFMYFATDKKETVRVTSTFRERRQALVKGGPGLLMPVIVLGGIYFGFFTATEAASVALVYSVLVTMLLGRLKFRDLPGVIRTGTLSSGMITMIIVGGHLLGDLVTLHRIPNMLIEFVETNEFPVVLVMLGIVIAYLVLGMFLEVITVMLITLPIVYPLVTSMGIDGIWFGVFVIILMEAALITPPVGLNLFIITDVAKSKLGTVVRGAIPYFILLLLAALIVALFPQLVTWLPSQIYG